MAKATLEAVYEAILARRGADPEHSYVARLNRKGEDTILQKIGEEACEVVIAAKNGVRREAIHELADLWFHLLVWMARVGIAPEDVERELGARFGDADSTGIAPGATPANPDSPTIPRR